MVSGVKSSSSDNGGSYPKSRLPMVDFIFRLLGIGATLTAAVVMGTNKQTVILPEVGPWPAKYQYTSAFVFFVAANALACGYTVLSLIFSLIVKPASSTLPAFFLSITDLVMLILVTAGASAAAAIGWLGRKGNYHSNWAKICNTYGRFCDRGSIAVFASFFGVIIFMKLTVMANYTLYKRTSCTR